MSEIPEAYLTATIKVLSNYQARLEREADILARSPETQSQVEDHRKLIEIVRRLVVFYSRLRC